MAHYAKIGKDNLVERVIVADQDFIDSGAVGDPASWIQTSYNTSLGVHKDGGIPLRKNFAGVGYTYDKNLDAFIPPKPEDSWVLNEEKGVYEAPLPLPKDGKKYDWNEATISWVEIKPVEQ